MTTERIDERLEDHYHITGVYADDTEAGFLFSLSLWEVVAEAANRVATQCDIDTEGASAYGEMGDYEEAWRLTRQADRLAVAAENLKRVEGHFRALEAGDQTTTGKLRAHSRYLRGFIDDGLDREEIDEGETEHLASVFVFLEELARDLDKLPAVFRGDDGLERLEKSARFSLGIDEGHNGYRVDLSPIEVWECAYGHACEFPTLDEWERAETLGVDLEDLRGTL